MKIAPTTGESFAKRKPLLPLVPEKEDKLNASNSVSCLLRVKPSEADSPTYKKYIRVLAGGEGVRTVLIWSIDQAQVTKGLDITTAGDVYELTCNLLKGSARTIYTDSVENACAAEKRRQVDAEADAGRKATLQRRGAMEFITDRIVAQAKREVIAGIVPNKTVAMVKRYLRRECRKPADMKVRTYYQHLLRINNDELIALPPFRPDQNMSEDELIDILVYATPKSWSREMDRQGFDPINKRLGEVVDFMERIKQAEDFDGQKVEKESSKSASKKKAKTGNSSSKDRYCLIHGPNTHPSNECKVLKAMAAENKSFGRRQEVQAEVWQQGVDSQGR